MTDDLALPPAPDGVFDFACACVDFVERAVGMRLEYEEETLPVVDHYLGQAPRPLTAEVLSLLASAAGCYFGEVLRRKFGARWVIQGENPAAWRLELEPCFLYFYPVGMAAEALASHSVEGYDGEFATSEERTGPLSEALEAAAPVDEPTYYSLSGRLEIISHAAQFLLAYDLEVERPHRYNPAAYQQAVDARQN